MDKRRHARLPTHLHAVVVCPRFGLFRGSVENLSNDGLYVRTHNVNMCIDVPVTLTLQGDERMPAGGCEVKGVVVHQDGNGFGVRFVDMEAACRRRILELAGSAGVSSSHKAGECLVL